jgi:hypothetical protein
MSHIGNSNEHQIGELVYCDDLGMIIDKYLIVGTMWYDVRWIKPPNIGWNPEQEIVTYMHSEINAFKNNLKHYLETEYD